ncbi:hypothetical protein D9M68_707410 [compost metagenome]
MLLDGVDIGGGDQLVDFIPMAAHEAAHAALALVILSGRIVFGDQGPGIHGCLCRFQRGAPALEQPAAHHRILDAIRAIQVPGIARAARAAARLVVRHVPAGAWVVGLLGFPGNDAALDVDFPGTGARTVHAVRAAHDFVVCPAQPVCIFPGAVFDGGAAVAIRKALLGQSEMNEAIEEVAHSDSFSARHGRVAAGIAPPGDSGAH